jgi:Spy/CpxP family protein refolding chaperone
MVRKALLGVILFAGAALVLSGSAWAQSAFAGNEAFLQLLKSDIQKETTDIINRSMELSAKDAAAFWPLYNEYDEALDQLADSRIKLIKEYSSIYGNVSDEQASRLGKKWIDLLAEREQLRGKYYGKFADVLTPAQAFKVMQIERRLELLIDMQIAKELPMLQ